MKKNYQSRQNGFVGVVFLAIALIGIVIAAIAAMSRSSSSGTADQAAKTNASIVIKQASDFKSGMDRMIVNGITPSTITFDSTVNTGLFDPTPGAQYAVRHAPPGAIMANGVGSALGYTYVKPTLPGIGAATSADYVVSIVDISIAGCQQINKILYNDVITQTPASSAGSSTAWGGTGSTFDDSANVAPNYVGRPEGCVISSDGKYVYYKAIVEN